MCTGRIIVWISLGLLPSLVLCRGRDNKPFYPSLGGKESLDPTSCCGQSRKLERNCVLYGSWSLTISCLILSLPVLLSFGFSKGSLSLSWPCCLNTVAAPERSTEETEKGFLTQAMVKWEWIQVCWPGCHPALTEQASPSFRAFLWCLYQR